MHSQKKSYQIRKMSASAVSGCRPTDGVPDMTVISDIDEHGINTNLNVRYKRDNIYVSQTELIFFSFSKVWMNHHHL